MNRVELTYYGLQPEMWIPLFAIDDGFLTTSSNYYP